MVDHVARRLHARCRGTLELEELQAAGRLGLVQAFRKHAAEDASFFVYSQKRIEGAILDYLRQRDPLNRGDRKRLRRVHAARDRLRQHLNREPEPDEVAAEAGFSPEAHEDLLVANRSCRTIPTADTLPPDGTNEADVWIPIDESPGVEERLDARRQLRRLDGLMAKLGANTRFALDHYYFQETTIAQIAKDLSVSEARVSQILKEGRERLKKLSLVRRARGSR